MNVRADDNDTLEVTCARPGDAIEELEWRWRDGQKRKTVYRVAGQPVWVCEWHEDGSMDREHGVRGTVPHGPYRLWHPKGALLEETFYVEGKEHGIAQQFDPTGSLLGTYTMRFGTGIVRRYTKPGVLSREIAYRDGEKHGFERFYWAYRTLREDSALWVECHYNQGKAHGIFREWNSKGGIRQGKRQCYVDGKKVNHAKYDEACATDPFLPPYRTEDDIFYRMPLPD